MKDLASFLIHLKPLINVGNEIFITQEKMTVNYSATLHSDGNTKLPWSR